MANRTANEVVAGSDPRPRQKPIEETIKTLLATRAELLFKSISSRLTEEERGLCGREELRRFCFFAALTQLNLRREAPIPE